MPRLSSCLVLTAAGPEGSREGGEVGAITLQHRELFVNYPKLPLVIIPLTASW